MVREYVFSLRTRSAEPARTRTLDSIYTSRMVLRARLFQNGGSQVVLLPKECRLPDDQSEVLVRQEGRCVILEPLDEWPSRFIETLGAWPAPIERPPRQAVGQQRERSR